MEPQQDIWTVPAPSGGAERLRVGRQATTEVRLPSRAATIVVTALFGVFGLIPAALHGRRAERLGGSSRRYWVAFGVTFGIFAVAAVALVVGLVVLLRVGDDEGAVEVQATLNSDELKAAIWPQIEAATGFELSPGSWQCGRLPTAAEAGGCQASVANAFALVSIDITPLGGDQYSWTAENELSQPLAQGTVSG